MRSGGAWNVDSGPIGLTLSHNNTSDGDDLQQFRNSVQSNCENDVINCNDDVIVCTTLSPEMGNKHASSTAVVPAPGKVERVAVASSCECREEVRVSPLPPSAGPKLNAVKIVKIVVPEIIQYGVQDAVILDCDYTYGNNTSGLVVKWFFRNKARPVYQWIVSQKPQDMGILRGRVDLAYRASSDPLKMYRALRIVKPNTDVSGDYTCVVSTFMEEDSRTKQMIVFVPESNFRLIKNKTDDDTVNVICAADGAFPAPNLTLATPKRRRELTTPSPADVTVK
ncbi:unnamed protein product [Parnassius apollo]|uniref:(apollo) hypothetical protein n=1 Tax=Parnassius apollo TaxID=110799 RepID=A0A8S3WF25_PARAO|nr:unnamed protein product [Parnassius apollo]